MRLHRIALEKNANTADLAFSGRGGLLGKGRWHSIGRPIVYTAEHISLAMAEALVHLQRSNMIAPFVRWEIDVPDALIAPAPALKSGWETDQAYTQGVGDAWLAGAGTVAMFVPSAIVPNERNCVLNPAHSSFKLSWVSAGPVPFSFDRRLTQR